jgi:hypothetical protein
MYYVHEFRASRCQAKLDRKIRVGRTKYLYSKWKTTADNKKL